ncbi:MAG: hypothetical protein JKX70_00010 [Phycisphaerales bacterium]|nr:hypothetical protein [Phycisphaerales bacterium]
MSHDTTAAKDSGIVHQGSRKNPIKRKHDKPQPATPLGINSVVQRATYS